jgi:hypothetical protein
MKKIKVYVNRLKIQLISNKKLQKETLNMVELPKKKSKYSILNYAIALVNYI